LTLGIALTSDNDQE